MKRKRRKQKKSNFGISILLFLVLIVLFSYASYLLYSFAKSNDLLNIKNNSNQQGNTLTENKKQNKGKLDFLTKLFVLNKSDNKTEDKNDSKNKIQIETKKIDINDIDTNNTGTSSIDTHKTDTHKTDTQNTDTQNTDTQNTDTKNNDTKKTVTKYEKKINSGNFIIYLAALNKEYELYLATKTEKIDYTDSPIFAVISFLINYKPKEPYLNLIPAGTKLLGAWIKQGILYLDFNENFLNNNNGLESIEIQIYQIVNTAMQFNEVKGVRFLIDGKIRKYYSEEGFLFDITFKKKSF